MEPHQQQNEPPRRRPYRPPIGIPTTGEPRTPATVAAVALHLLIALLVLAPTLFVSAQLIDFQQEGAGGPGPAGGGGGGSRGSGGAESARYAREQLDFVVIAPPPPKKPEPKKPEEPIKEEAKIVPPPPPPPPPEPEPQVSVDTAAKAALPADSGVSVVKGTDGGSGNDGTAGSGPGRGGGVGSGVGTGRGSGTGPGTGGGEGTIYPPAVVSLPILPLPIPPKVRPYRMVAQFEVDSLGNAKLLAFNPSRDAGYNRRIREMLLEIRFRPAVRADGTPVKALAVVTAEAM